EGAQPDVFEKPAAAFALRFAGHVNVFDAQLERGRARVGGVEIIVDLDGVTDLPRVGRVYVRRHDVDIARAPVDGAVPAKVVRVTPRSAGLKVELDVPPLPPNLRADIHRQRGRPPPLATADHPLLP